MRKIKELEDRTAIHCKTKEDAMKLVTYYGMPEEFVDYWDGYKEKTCYFYEPSRYFSSNPWSYADCCYAIGGGWKLIEIDELFEEEVEEISELKPGDKFKVANPPRDNYIVCELTSGEVMKFDGYCNNINWWGSNNEFLMFNSGDALRGPLVHLAAVKVDEIKRITWIESEEALMTTIKNEEGENS